MEMQLKSQGNVQINQNIVAGLQAVTPLTMMLFSSLFIPSM
jgi:hypothetical protein